MKQISLDLDETLICSLQNRYAIGLSPRAMISVYKNGEKINTCVFLRPGIEEFLEKLQGIGRINLFTHGVHDYAHTVLRETGLRKHFDRVITREDTLNNLKKLSPTEIASWGYTPQSAVWIKDLRLISSDLHNVVAIDNEHSFYAPPHRPRLIHVPNFDKSNPSFPDQPEELFQTLPDQIRAMLSKRE